MKIIMGLMIVSLLMACGGSDTNSTNGGVSRGVFTATARDRNYEADVNCENDAGEFSFSATEGGESGKLLISGSAVSNNEYSLIINEKTADGYIDFTAIDDESSVIDISAKGVIGSVMAYESAKTAAGLKINETPLKITFEVDCK